MSVEDIGKVGVLRRMRRICGPRENFTTAKVLEPRLGGCEPFVDARRPLGGRDLRRVMRSSRGDEAPVTHDVHGSTLGAAGRTQPKTQNLTAASR